MSINYNCKTDLAIEALNSCNAEILTEVPAKYYPYIDRFSYFKDKLGEHFSKVIPVGCEEIQIIEVTDYQEEPDEYFPVGKFYYFKPLNNFGFVPYEIEDEVFVIATDEY